MVVVVLILLFLLENAYGQFQGDFSFGDPFSEAFLKGFLLESLKENLFKEKTYWNLPYQGVGQRGRYGDREGKRARIGRYLAAG